MNGSQPQQGQPGQQPQQPQMQRQPKLFRPEQMRNLPDKFSAEEKRKWENGLTMLYGQMENNPPDSQIHRDAYKKIHDFSMTLMNKMQQQAQANAAAQQQRPQGQTPQQRPQGQPMQQQQQQQSSQSDGSSNPQQSSQGQQGQPGSQQQQQQQPRPGGPPQPSQNMREHVNTFPYVAPPGAKAPEWIASMKDKYLKALLNMEHASATLKKMDTALQARAAAGKPLTPAEEKDMQMKKDHMTRAHADSKRFVETFRRQQTDLLAQRNAAAAAAGQNQQQPTQAPQQIAVPPRPAMSLQQPANAGQNMAVQSTEAVQAAMQAARQQQANGARVNVPNAQNQGQSDVQNQNHAGQQPQQQQVNVNAPQQSVQVNQNQPQTQNQNFPNIKQEPSNGNGPVNLNIAQAQQPHIQQMQAQARAAQQNQQNNLANTPQAQQQQQQQQGLNQGQNLNQTPTQPQPLSQQPQSQSNIQTPVSAGPIGPPKPLSQSDAIAHAHSQRTYSSQQTTSTPNVIASHSHPQPQRDAIGIKSNLMPIPKTLPQAVQGPPVPVSMPPARPTMAMGSASLMSPAVPKPPQFKVEGDTERVLGKRKLDELVRQVTGGSGVTGSESLEEGLGPEVEDAVLTVADTFVDQVILAACKCAKSRGSKTLEIRDIQLILERNYNIRIPGYASDEIRTVRKFVPAQGWINKMSAIQAAKVTRGTGE